MKNKLLSVLLSLCVVLALMPSTALAANKITVTTGDALYELLDYYDGTAANGDTIKLGADIQYSIPSKHPNQPSLGGNPLGVKDGNEVTLDLCGKILDITAPYQVSFFEVSSISNDTLPTKLKIIDSVGGGELKLTSGNALYGIEVRYMGTLELDGVNLNFTATAEDFTPGLIPCAIRANGGTIDIKNSVITASSSASEQYEDSKPNLDVTLAGIVLDTITPISIEGSEISATSDYTEAYGVVIFNAFCLEDGEKVDVTIENCDISAVAKTNGKEAIGAKIYEEQDSFPFEVDICGSSVSAVTTTGAAKGVSFTRTGTSAAVTLTDTDVSAKATGGTSSETVNPSGGLTVNFIEKAAIGSTQYANLWAAVAAAQTNDTIKLLRDVTLTDALEIKDGKNVTLDLNNHTLQRTEKVITITNGKLNVTGTGTIQETDNDKYAPIYIMGSQSSTDANYSVVAIGENVTLKGWSGIFIAKPASPDSDGKYHAYGVVVNFNGAIESPADSNHTTGGHGIYINGLIQDTTANCPKITIGEKARVTATKGGGAIYAAGYADWTINGGTFTGSNGVELKAGKMTVNGGNFTATTTQTTVGKNNNGTSSAGYALSVVDSKGYGNPREVTITGGNFTGPVATLDDEPGQTEKHAKLTITGGYFTTNPKAYVPSTHQAGTSELTGYSYKVQVFEPVEEIDIPEEIKPVPPVVPEPVVELPPDAALSQDDMNLATNAATSAKETTIDGDSATDLSTLAVSYVIGDIDPNNPDETKIKIGNEEKTIADVLQDTANDVKNVLGLQGAAPNASELTIVVQPSLDIKVTGASVAGTDTPAILNLDITPMSQILVTTKTVADAGNIVGNASGATNANAVKVGEPQPIETATSWPPITITIPLPEDFVNSTGASLLIKHDKGGGEVYYYTATLSVDNTKNPTQYYATFTVTKGFSSFTLMATTDPTLAVTYYDSNGTTLIGADTYVASDVNDALLNQTKAGHTFDGWKLLDDNNTAISGVNGTYKTLTQALWGLLMPPGSTSKAINAVAQFTPIAPGGGGGGGGGARTYTINAAATDNGSVTLSRISAASGTAITVTLKPDAGYESDTVTVKDAKDNAVDVTKNADGTYTFTMPAANVTVTATFKAASTDAWANPFTDVSTGDWFYGAVRYVNENGLMQGTGATTFEPLTAVDRAMMATILYRLEGEPAVTGENPFTDVAAGQWYTDAVIWAAQNEIVNGYGDGKFGPADPLTREQMAAMLYHYEQYKGGGFTGSWAFQPDFADCGDISDWAYEAMCWCVMNGIVRGVGDNSLAPQGGSNRAQLAAVLERYTQL